MFWNKSKGQAEPKPEKESKGFWSTEIQSYGMKRPALVDAVIKKTFGDLPLPMPQSASGQLVAMDANSAPSLRNISNSLINTIPDAQLGWYGGQGFIGYALCAVIAQQWLVDKACTMPARDAIRKGFEITVNDGTEVNPDIFDKIRQADKRMGLKKNLVEFVRMGRVFGFRIALFKVESNDPLYYENPFNPDGVTKGSYKGIAQIDPYWITPELDFSATDPASLDFYEPTWWRVNGNRIHKSHLVIFRNSELPDLLKPAYMYGGMSVPQKIYERVYASERTANEAPQLALTKRTTVIHADMEQVTADPASFEEKMQLWARFRDNYGIKTLGLEETAEQFDTTLTDLDATIMTQYQLVAAASEVPATKLMGTAPKGFNSTGEYEESSYHEMLESIQEHDLTRLIDRHHLLLIRSEIAPENPFSTTVTWNPLDTPTAKELSDMNKVKADTDNVLVSAGAIDGNDIRNRLIADPKSGYSGLEPMEDLPPIDEKEIDDLEKDEEKEKEAQDSIETSTEINKIYEQIEANHKKAMDSIEGILSAPDKNLTKDDLLSMVQDLKISLLESMPAPQQAPIINITNPAPPAINIPAAQINMTMPEIKYQAPDVNIVNQIPEQKAANVKVSMPDVKVNVTTAPVNIDANLQSPDVKVIIPPRKTETTVNYDDQGNIINTTQIEKEI